MEMAFKTMVSYILLLWWLIVYEIHRDFENLCSKLLFAENKVWFKNIFVRGIAISKVNSLRNLE